MHLFSARLRFWDGMPRSVWLSVAGGVILSVLKQELPEERQSRCSAFGLGVAGYAALLVAA